ncbi:MAG: hypothetical protein U5K54_08165 [Cytophagales bacterium]|nr:hypothetical protein [Cytophagales bacterium]
MMQEADIAEEILRIYGFNNIELSEIAGTDYLAEFPEKDINKYKRTLSRYMLQLAMDIFEILTNSLTNVAYQQKHNLKF